MSDRKGSLVSVLGAAIVKFRSGVTLSDVIVWGFFCATCLHLAFLVPSGSLTPGYRAKIFSGLMCAATLAVVWFFRRPRDGGKVSGEVVVSAVLTVLTIISGLLSSTPGPSTARGFVVLSSGLGGFWCARLLLNTESSQRFFRSFCLLILSVLLLACLWGYLSTGAIYELLDTNPHPVADRILLLWFAPLSLLFAGSLLRRAVGGLHLLVSYVVFYLSDLRSAFLTPIVLVVLAAFFRMIRLRYVVLIVILASVATMFFVRQLPWTKIGTEHEPAYYRAENYVFSLHIALKHPLLGIGLTAPRGEFLEDYEVKYPYVTKEKFAHSVTRIGVSENIFLTFMAELGFPFVILYGVSLIILAARLVREAFQPSGSSFLHPLALLLPITAGLLHFLVYDGLLHPQVSWFFHILLGLIPMRNQESDTKLHSKKHNAQAPDRVLKSPLAPLCQRGARGDFPL